MLNKQKQQQIVYFINYGPSEQVLKYLKHPGGRWMHKEVFEIINL